MFQNSSKRYYLYTFILFWCALVVVSSVYVVTPLTDTFSSYFQVSEQETTWIGSVFSGCYAIGFLLFVPLVESFGKRQLIVFGLVMLTWLTFLLAFAEAFWFFVPCRAFLLQHLLLLHSHMYLTCFQKTKGWWQLVTLVLDMF
nr:MFS transporter [Virgibacillus massiliensis]